MLSCVLCSICYFVLRGCDLQCNPSAVASVGAGAETTGGHTVQLSQVVYSIEVSFVLFKRYLVSSFQLCERVSMLHVTSINFVFCFAHVV